MDSLTLNKNVKELFFTLNNYTAEDESTLQQLKFQYLVYGRELAPTTGTPHLQGLIQFKRQRALGPILKALGGRMHVETPLDLDASRRYCKKDGDFFESGELILKQGQRTDLSDIKQKITEEGATVRRLIGDLPLNYQQLKYAETLQKYVPPPKIERTINWLWGETGAGKTHRAMMEAEAISHDIAVLSGNLNFLNGYDGHTLVIIDDFRPKQIDFDMFLRLLDRNPVTTNVKGSTSPWRATHIWITSPSHPAHLWYKTDAAQVIRRIMQSPGGGIHYIEKAIDDIDWVEETEKLSHEAYQLIQQK